MFCRKCGEVIDDGEELCQACSGKQKVWSESDLDVKKAFQEVRKKAGEIGKIALDDSMKNVQKAVRKKVNQITNKAMVKVGLKKKTPLDMAKDVWKKVKR